MEVLSSNQSGIEIQISLIDSIVDLLTVKPIFLWGIVLIGILMIIIFRKDNNIPKTKTAVISLIMYYYLCLVLTNIIGMPTLSELIRISQLGESLFNPNINLIPMSDGFSLSFILNILLFIPLGFLCPLISKTFEDSKNTLLIGFGMSLFIETIQLFTLYRATDINDLLANVIGTMIGYACFKLISKLRIIKQYSDKVIVKSDYTAYIPMILIVITLLLGFLAK